MDGAAGADAVEPDAVERLFHYYGAVWNYSLRWTLHALHLALAGAVAAGAGAIGTAFIDDAAAAAR